MKAATTTVEVQGIQIAVPVGSMDKPSERSEQIMRASQDPRNWKMPLSPFHTYNLDEAQDLCYCYDFYCGGHEFERELTADDRILYKVSSKGYYHYVGA